MMKTTFFSAALLLAFALNGQNPTKKGDCFFYWGYNRALFSKSTIYFKGPGYAFAIYDARAHDAPTHIGTVYFNPTTFTIPQYNARLGYFLTNRFAVSFGIDHMKYVMDQNQRAAVSGVIDGSASAVYAGSYLFDTLQISPDFVRFEHTDGLNLVSFDLEFLQPLFFQKRLAWDFGIGGIWMATRTDSRIFGSGINNDFHVSGFTFHAKTGPRISLGKRFYLLAETRGGVVSLPWIQLRNWEPFSAEQNFFFLEFYAAVGVKFRLHRHKSISERKGRAPKNPAL